MKDALTQRVEGASSIARRRLMVGFQSILFAGLIYTFDARASIDRAVVDADDGPSSNAPSDEKTLSPRPRITARSVAYVLQPSEFGSSKNAVVKKLAACDRDLIVMEPAFDQAVAFSAKEIDKIRAGRSGRLVVAYLSIGEAETYRSYWNPAWDADTDGIPDEAAPEFLAGENPDWAGNYKVRYWRPEWQELMMPQLDAIVEAGFDGVFLDIVDAFEFFETVDGEHQDDRINPETNRTYRGDMIAWVKTLADRARSRRPRFVFIPQNGSQLLADESFRAGIDAVALEDLFTLGDEPQSHEHTEYILDSLQPWLEAAGPVFCTEYATKKRVQKLAIDGCAKHRLTLLLTDRPLKTLGTAYPVLQP